MSKKNQNKENDSIIKVCIDQNFTKTDDILRSAEVAVKENPLNVPLVKITPVAGAPPARDPFSLAVLTGTRWENGRKLRIEFLNGDEERKNKVIEIAKEWENYANLKFDFVTEGNTDIRIAFKFNGDRGSWSTLGTDALQRGQRYPTMNYGWLDPNTSDDEYDRVVLHEFGHALGAIHEHQNPAGIIPWDKEKVYEYYMGPPNNWTKEEVDHNLFRKYSKEITQFTELDITSIMTYRIPNEHTIGDFEVPWNKKLSKADKEFMASIYPFETKQIIELVIGKSAQEEEIKHHNEEDFYSFSIEKKGKYSIRTQGSTDVAMGLLGPDSQTDLIDEDNDSGYARNARIITNLEPAKYYLRIRHYQPTGTGKYKILVEEAKK